MKIEKTRIHFDSSETFSLPSPSSDLKVPIFLLIDGPTERAKVT